MNTYFNGWQGWQQVPGGLTDVGPAVMAYDGGLMLVVKDAGLGIWYNTYNGSWREWTLIDGLTNTQPELTPSQ
ncbi:MAG: hypothetical protein QXK12_03970 [Candidatus Nezhaarchaeales archaeon]